MAALDAAMSAEESVADFAVEAHFHLTNYGGFVLGIVAMRAVDGRNPDRASAEVPDVVFPAARLSNRGFGQSPNTIRADNRWTT